MITLAEAIPDELSLRRQSAILRSLHGRGLISCEDFEATMESIAFWRRLRVDSWKS